MKLKNAGLFVAALVALSIAFQRTASAIVAASTESVNLSFTGVATQVNSVYALVIDQGAVESSNFYLDDAVSLGSISTGNSTMTFSFDTPSTETPVGIILAGIYGSIPEPTGVVHPNFDQTIGLTLGLNSTLAASSFVGQDFNVVSAHYGGEPEPAVIVGIADAAPGYFFTSPFFTNLIEIPPLSSSTPWVALDGSQAGTVVNFSNGASNGAFSASTAVPAPSPAWAALIGLTAIAAWKLTQRRAQRA